MSETIVNESLNTTGNSSEFWLPLNGFEIPDVSGWLDTAALKAEELLASWGFEPFKVVFSLFLLACVVIIIYYYFTKASSKASDIFKPILLIVGLFVVLLLLGVI